MSSDSIARGRSGTTRASENEPTERKKPQNGAIKLIREGQKRRIKAGILEA